MKEQLISFKTAKLAKEKGFDSYSEDFYWNETGKFETSLSGIINDNTLTKTYSQTQLQRWLREKHNLYLYIERSGGCWNWVVEWYNNYKEGQSPDEDVFPTFEEQLEIGLFETLKLLPTVEDKT